MPIMLPNYPLDSHARDPRAQFFANRAYAHAYAVTSFEQIHALRKTARDEVELHLTRKPRETVLEI